MRTPLLIQEGLGARAPGVVTRTQGAMKPAHSAVANQRPSLSKRGEYNPSRVRCSGDFPVGRNAEALLRGGGGQGRGGDEFLTFTGRRGEFGFEVGDRNIVEQHLGGVSKAVVDKADVRAPALILHDSA